MTLEILMSVLFAVSTLTSLVVEGIKKLLDEKGKKYSSNALAGIVAVALGLVIGVLYCVFMSQAVTAQVVVWLVALVFLSWLCAMFGYDKVKQTVEQIRK